MKDKPTLIGITGNIATGESVVRRMLANAGALGLDADVIAHRMIYPQGPAYQDVVKTFGKKILSDNGEILRARLGEIVFNSPDQLAILESIVHPAVNKAIQKRLEGSQSPLAALEAIKLLEAGLGEICDAVWVCHVPREIQLERLLQTRHLTEDEAWSRINVQPPQEEKLNQADVIIHTDGPFQRTWDQVVEGLSDTIQERAVKTPPPLALPGEYNGPSVHDMPFDKLLRFWETLPGKDSISLYEALGLQMIQPLMSGEKIQALLLWENWNFTAALTQVLPAETLLVDIGIIMDVFTAAARQQRCEILLLPDEMVRNFDLKPGNLGFERRKPGDLPYPAWRYAAQALASENQVWTQILSKPLDSKGEFQLE